MSKQCRNPDWLGIGCQKAGTTWLWQQMRQHPQIGMPELYGKKTKEIHFFDRFTIPLKRYLTKFGKLEHKKVGEFTPNYFSCPYAPDMIKYLFPQVKLFTIFRNPVDRAFSHYKDHLYYGKIPPDVKFIDAFFEDHPRTEFKCYSIKEKGMYADLLDVWNKRFAQDQLKIYFYDDLVAQPAQFLKSVFEWIDVDSNFLPIDYEQKVLKSYNKAFDNMKISSEDRAKVSDFYKDQISKLSDMVGRHLSWS